MKNLKMYLFIDFIASLYNINLNFIVFSIFAAMVDVLKTESDK